MRRRTGQDDLDNAARRVVRSDRLSPQELEAIVSSPDLFDGILQRIKADEPVVSKKVPARLGWALAGTSFLSLAVLLMVILLAYGRKDLSVEHAADVSVPPMPKLVKIEHAAEPPIDMPDDEPESPKVTMAAAREPEQKMPRRRAARQERPVVRENFENGPEAYHIAFPGNLEDAIIDGRVVTVDMPRAALFALGVDIPLENGTKLIKTEMLLGPDGAPRAIRLVE